MYLPSDILRDLVYLHDRINNLFEERLKTIYSATEISGDATWSPAVDIYETEKDIILTAELPGVELKNVRIELDNNELVLIGNRHFPKDGLRKDDYHRLEGSYGRFERRFPLPSAVDREAVKATLKNGILKVSIPKLAEHKMTRIAIEDR